MLFPFGWPKAYRAFPAPKQPDKIIAILPSNNQILLASQKGLQIWSSGQNPIKLGQAALSEEDMEEVGLQTSVVWSPALKSVVTLTDRGWLLFFLLQESPHPILPPGTGSVGPRHLKVYQIYPAVGVGLYGGDLGSCLCTDGAMVLVGMQDGGLQGYMWREILTSLPQGSTYDWTDKDPSWYCGSVDPVTLNLSLQSLDEEDEEELRLGMSFASGPVQAAHGGVVHMDYCPAVRSLLLTFEDGSVALCMTAEWGLQPLERLVLRQWVYRGTGNKDDPHGVATCARLGDAAGLVAVGFKDGTVSTFRLSSFTRQVSMNAGGDSVTPIPSVPPLRTMSLIDWGHNVEVTGAVHDIKWSQNCRAFAVGFKKSGVAVWTPSGCRLMCSLPQTSPKGSGLIHPRSSSKSQTAVPEISEDKSNSPPLNWGVSALAWGPHQYRLWIAQTGVPQEMWELKFVQTPICNHRVSRPQEEVLSKSSLQNLEEMYLLQADDRILLVSEGMNPFVSAEGSCLSRINSFDPYVIDDSQSDLALRHILLPQDYIAENWPVSVTSVSPDNSDIAVAGKRGMALFSRRSDKWKLFGDIAQERAVRVLFLTWLHKIIVACTDPSAAEGSAYAPPSKVAPPSELLLFPRYHLDFGSLLARYSLKETPAAVDSLDNYILVASRPLEVLVLEVKVEGVLELSGSPQATLVPVRELSIMTMEQPIANVALVRMPVDDEKSHSEAAVPKRCVVLRWGGVLTLLDLEEGVETILTSDVECFWLSDPTRVDSHKSATISGKDPEVESTGSVESPVFRHRRNSLTTQDTDAVEMPWWAYGGRGMELWFPSSLGEPLSPRRTQNSNNHSSEALDPELEFDREVYPIGISLGDAAIIGVTQRMARPPLGQMDESVSLSVLPSFHPIPESQPVLPCLLRRLLQRGAYKEAKLLAQRHQELGLHFSRSLEWLLFTSLEHEGEQRMHAKKHPTTSAAMNGSLLKRAAALVKNFPLYPDVIVSVARKTDVQYWPLLFDAVGRPSKLLEVLLRQGALHGAACLLIVIEQLEGEVLARALSMQLLEAALSSGHYDLVAELVRHLMSPSEFDIVFMVEPKLTEDESTSSQTIQAPEAPDRASFGSWLYSWIWPSSMSQPSSSKPNGLSGQCREATLMVQEHVRHLLDVGKLALISQLGRALAPLGGGLPAMMSTAKNGTGDTMDDNMTPQDLVVALSTAISELVYPVPDRALFDAEVVLETSQQMRYTAWTVALALMLRDMPVLVGFRIHHPELWSQFTRDLTASGHFKDFLSVIEAVQSSE